MHLNSHPSDIAAAHGRSRRVVVALVAAGALLTAGACGDGSDGEGSSKTTAETSTSETTETTQSKAPAPAQLDIVAMDHDNQHSFDMGGVTQVPAGAVEINLRNEGTEDHAATVVRYRDGKTFDDLGAALAQPDKLYEVLETYGGPNAIAPGDTGSATVYLEPGKYSVFCFIPSPSDGIPHLVKGMMADLEVTSDAEPPALPAAETTIELLDYSFGVPDDLTAGESVEVRNAGQVAHELAIYQPTGDATAEQVLEMLTAEAEAAGAPSGPPPFKGVGGVSPLDGGLANVTKLPDEPGEYVFLCFLPTPGSGAPHHTEGMAKVVTLG